MTINTNHKINWKKWAGFLEKLHSRDGEKQREHTRAKVYIMTTPEVFDTREMQVLKPDGMAPEGMAPSQASTLAFLDTTFDQFQMACFVDRQAADRVANLPKFGANVNV